STAMGSTGGAVVDGQSTSMAWRPLYQPQLPHTTWGCFAAPQRGQVLRAGVPSFQAEARRLRLFDLDIFFFGTAIAVLPGAGGAGAPADGGVGSGGSRAGVRARRSRHGGSRIAGGERFSRSAARRAPPTWGRA